MSETLTMSTKERQRLQVISHLRHGKTTVARAAAAVGVTERQMYRILQRYLEGGDAGLIHRLRGHNARFARADHLRDVHRSAEGLDLDNIFCFESLRSVNYDHTITLEARYIQLLPSIAPLPPPRQKVTVRRWLDDSLHISSHDHELQFRYLDAKPKPKPRTCLPAPHSHPLRDRCLGNKKKRARHFRYDA